MNPAIMVEIISHHLRVVSTHRKQIEMKKKYVIRKFKTGEYHAPNDPFYNHFSHNKSDAKKYDTKKEAELFIRTHVSSDCIIEKIYIAQ